MSDIRVLIVADDPLARAGLAALIGNQPNCVIVGQLPSNTDLGTTLNVYRPEVILWDMGWDTSATERMADVKEIPIVALIRDETHAADTWTAGARGLLRRDTSAQRLEAALSSARQGLAVIDPALGISIFPQRERPPSQPTEDLTSRELEVLQLLAEGLPNKHIAQRLSISEHTVKFHINAILSKLGAQSRTDAVVKATRSGLIIL